MKGGFFMQQRYYGQNFPVANNYSNDDRFLAGGFLGPFVLGGITGGLLAPAFYGPRPYYNNNYYYPYQPYPYYPYR